MELEFFRMVSEAAFSNPFRDERIEIDRKIVGAPANEGWERLFPRLLDLLAAQIESLDDTRRYVRARQKDPDARAVTVSLLFQLYHRYMEKFDGLIEQQLAAGDESSRAPFAGQCLSDLQHYGFGRNDAARYVAIFYQIRRAFYFISNGLLGESACMKQFRARLWSNVFTHDMAWYEQALWNRMEDFSTLLLGETGTGKGAAAAAIGRSGYIPFNPATERFEESFTRAFVSINLSQYPESLIESELFGHRKGAFTGAVEKHDGIFARCSSYGAIFLDEIGDVSAPIQIKLLQVLQERVFSPVGSHDRLRFKGRVIAATNHSVDALRRDKVFRDDFYYRLCSDIITVPPLRQRIRETSSELELLCTHLVERIAGASHSVPVVDVLLESVGVQYAWPGNVRELEQAVRRILISGTYTGDVAAQAPAVLERGAEEHTLTARQLVEQYCGELYEIYGNYGEVARRTGLDWRTVKKNVQAAQGPSSDLPLA